MINVNSGLVNGLTWSLLTAVEKKKISCYKSETSLDRKLPIIKLVLVLHCNF